MIEVKQGPYNIKTDKKIFNSIDDKFVKINDSVNKFKLLTSDRKILLNSLKKN